MRRYGFNRLRETFPSTNEWGIPDLDPEMLGWVDDPSTPFVVWRHTRPEPTILGFFVDDYQFKCVWNYPERALTAIQQREYVAVCEPDFSLYDDRPRAEWIWSVYKARWCGVFWQRNGIRVIPTLMWVDEDSYKFVWAGIPKNPPCVALETRAAKSDPDGYNEGVVAAIDYLQPKQILVYGPEGPCYRALQELGLQDTINVVAYKGFSPAKRIKESKKLCQEKVEVRGLLPEGVGLPVQVGAADPVAVQVGVLAEETKVERFSHKDGE